MTGKERHARRNCGAAKRTSTHAELYSVKILNVFFGTSLLASQVAQIAGHNRELMSSIDEPSSKSSAASRLHRLGGKHLMN